MGDDGNQQDGANDPQCALMREQRLAHGAQECAVFIQRLFAAVRRQVQLQVAGHVANNEEGEKQASDGHDELQNPGGDSRLLADWFVSDVAVSYCLTVGIS